MENKQSEAKIKAQLELLNEVERSYWESQPLTVFRIMELNEKEERICTKVLVMSNIPDVYVKIPNGEYLPEQYERLVKLT